MPFLRHADITRMPRKLGLTETALWPVMPSKGQFWVHFSNVYPTPNQVSKMLTSLPRRRMTRLKIVVINGVTSKPRCLLDLHHYDASDARF